VRLGHTTMLYMVVLGIYGLCSDQFRDGVVFGEEVIGLVERVHDRVYDLTLAVKIEGSFARLPYHASIF